MKKLPLNLIYLKYFYDAVQNKSISRSAKLNHVSQSAVSQGIAKLEEGLTSTLISHQPNRFQVTEFGNKLFAHAKEIFRTIQETEDAISDEKQVTITFGCTHSLALSCLPKYIQLTREHLPKIRLNFRLGHYFNVKEWIKRGDIDFGILLDNDDLSYFDCHKLHQGEYRLYAPKGVKRVDDLPFLLDSEERVETNILKRNYKAQFGKALPVLMEVSSWCVVAQLVKEGLGIGLCPDYIAYGNEEITPCFPKLNPMGYTLYALFDKNRDPSRGELAFLELFARFPLNN